MCWFFIVVKLLMLKILLAGLTGFNTASTRYDYGYHPSAEEFDNILRETRRTWTHAFLKADRDRLLKSRAQRGYETVKNRGKTEGRYFVPKFQYDTEPKNKLSQFTQSPLSNKHHYDLHKASSYKPQVPLQNIGSSLDFNYFSDELPKPGFNTPQDIQHTLVRQPTTAIKPVTTALPEISLKPIAKPSILNSNKYSLNNLYKNNTQGHFHIYFTNPATGIVYAITEVGKSTENITKTNGAIPIFITKEQYERDIFQLKNKFEQNCENLRSTTSKPQIIKLQKPSSPALSIISTKFTSTNAKPTTLKKPFPVVLEAELTVKDKQSSTVRPLRKKKKKTKPKRKIEKPNPPGRKPLGNTIRPLLPNQPQGPAIIIGSRTTTTKSLTNNENLLSTQLEKPNFDNIFSSAVMPQIASSQAVTLNPNLFNNNHRINKRSVNKEFQSVNKLSNAENISFELLKNVPTIANTDAQNKTTKYLFQTSTELLVNDNLTKTNLFEQDRNDFSKLTKTLQKALNNETSNIVLKLIKNKRDLKKALNNTELNNSEKNNFKHFIPDNLSIKVKNSTTKHYSSKTKQIITQNSDITKFKTHKPSDFQAFTNKTQSKTTSDLIRPRNNLTRENKKNFEINNTFLDIKHRINKRSTFDLTTNNYTSPKFIKILKTLNSSINKSEQNNTINNVLKTNNQNSEPQTSLKTHKNPSTNSTQIIIKRKSTNNNQRLLATRNSNVPDSGKKRTQTLSRSKKRLLKMKNRKLQSNQTPTINKTIVNSNLITKPRTVKQGSKKLAKKNKKIKKKSKRQQDTEYNFFGMDENYDEEEDDEDEGIEYEDDDDGEEEDDEEDDNGHDEIQAYDDDTEVPQTHTSEDTLSLEDLSEKPTQETSSSPEEDADIGALEIENKSPMLNYDNVGNIGLKTKSKWTKKRIHRRPPQLKIDDDYEEEDEGSSMSSNLGGFFRMIFYPIQVVMSSVMDSIGSKEADVEEDDPTFNPYTQYTSYHNTLKQHSNADYDEDYDYNESSDFSVGSWLSSWFGLNRRNKKIGSTTVAPVQMEPTKSSTSWLPSLLGFGEYDKWFASWFGDTKPKARKRTTTTTSTTPQLPYVPILTIVDPMRNPQNWIGILAHHIINQPSSSTANPLKDMWNQMSSTTTENPEIPRKISYDKYQIWRLKPQDDSQVKALDEYKKSEDGIKLQWLKGPSLRGLTDVLVPPQMLVDFQASLTFELVDHEILIFDVGKAIAYEKTKEDYFFTTTQKPKKQHSQSPAQTTGMTWRKYYDYDDIIKFLETMRMRFPHLVELIHIGRSYEGRPLIIVKIESKEAAAVNSAHYPAHERNKLRHKKRIGLANAVFIEAGTHGMEWIGPATATWIINELLRIMKKNVTDDQSFIRNTTWYILPVLNPDGYVYSHEFDRFWQKSRSRHVFRPSGILNSAMTWLQKKRAKEKVCFGVDLNRNWHYQWGRRGTSKTPCNDFYAGPTPFSEPETKALSQFLMDYRTQIKLFVSMQAYGQIISYPYKANTTYDTERLDDLLDVAMVGTDGLRKKGSKARYKINSSNDLMENRSGCSDAFAAYEVGIPFSYTLQLADNGVHGYLLPSASIESTAKDSFQIITGMLDYI